VASQDPCATTQTISPEAFALAARIAAETRWRSRAEMLITNSRNPRRHPRASAAGEASGGAAARSAGIQEDEQGVTATSHAFHHLAHFLAAASHLDTSVRPTAWLTTQS
jgi:hypothetical protein